MTRTATLSANLIFLSIVVMFTIACDVWKGGEQFEDLDVENEAVLLTDDSVRCFFGDELEALPPKSKNIAARDLESFAKHITAIDIELPLQNTFSVKYFKCLSNLRYLNIKVDSAHQVRHSKEVDMAEVRQLLQAIPSKDSIRRVYLEGIRVDQEIADELSRFKNVSSATLHGDSIPIDRIGKIFPHLSRLYLSGEVKYSGGTLSLPRSLRTLQYSGSCASVQSILNGLNKSVDLVSLCVRVVNHNDVECQLVVPENFYSQKNLEHLKIEIDNGQLIMNPSRLFGMPRLTLFKQSGMVRSNRIDAYKKIWQKEGWKLDRQWGDEVEMSRDNEGNKCGC